MASLRWSEAEKLIRDVLVGVVGGEGVGLVWRFGRVVVALVVQPRAGRLRVLRVFAGALGGVGLGGADDVGGVDAVLDCLGPGPLCTGLAGGAGVDRPELVEREVSGRLAAMTGRALLVGCFGSGGDDAELPVDGVVRGAGRKRFVR